jgi:hypothetical protein
MLNRNDTLEGFHFHNNRNTTPFPISEMELYYKSNQHPQRHKTSKHFTEDLEVLLRLVA